MIPRVLNFYCMSYSAQLTKGRSVENVTYSYLAVCYPENRAIHIRECSGTVFEIISVISFLVTLRYLPAGGLKPRRWSERAPQVDSSGLLVPSRVGARQAREPELAHLHGEGSGMPAEP